MAESGVIQEMLINIGFKTDEAGQRRYQDTIAEITKGAAVLVTSLTGAAVAATAAIDKISTDLSVSILQFSIASRDGGWHDRPQPGVRRCYRLKRRGDRQL